MVVTPPGREENPWMSQGSSCQRGFESGWGQAMGRRADFFFVLGEAGRVATGMLH
jgi:hypothetical protein